VIHIVTTRVYQVVHIADHMMDHARQLCNANMVEQSHRRPLLAHDDKRLMYCLTKKGNHRFEEASCDYL